MASKDRNRFLAFSGDAQNATNTGGQSHLTTVGGDSFPSAEWELVTALRKTEDVGVIGAVALDLQRASDGVTSGSVLWQLGVDVGGEKSGHDLAKHFVDVDVEYGAGFRIAAPEFSRQTGRIFRRNSTIGSEVGLVTDQHQRNVFGT